MTELINESIIDINNNGPKKRGRKPKIKINDVNVQIIEPKKRGRKPKVIQDTDVVSKKKTNKEKTNKEKSKKIDNNDFINTKIDIELSKELDLSIGNITDNALENTDIISNIWLNKYQPKTLNGIIGNRDQILKIKKWLSNYESSPFHAAVISGGHGIGKNLIVKLALSELGYQIKNMYSTSLKNKNIVSEIIHSCAKTKNVFTSFNQSNNQKYAIVIDDTESITLRSEKNNLLELFKFNAEHKYFPIIFISNLQHSKLINNLKKLSLEITLYPPQIEVLKDYITNICKKESMIITDIKIYYHIIKFCQSDIRRLLFVLQDLYYTYNKKPITIEMFKEYIQLSQKKDIDVGLYYAAKNLLDNYKNINDCIQLYDTVKVLLPLTIYENYYRKIFKQNMHPTNILKIMANLTNSVSIGDVIETNIYSDQNWYLQNIHGFYTCADTSYIINKTVETDNKQILDYELVFSADLNKFSSKNINKKKNIVVLQSKFKNKNIDDILYINKIFFELERNKQTPIIKSLKESYNIDSKCIQIALKIDKTNEKLNEKTTKKSKNKNVETFDEVSDYEDE